MADFKELVQEEFRVLSELEISYKDEGINLWIGSNEQKDYPLRNLWIAVIGGGKTPVYNAHGDVEERFSVSLTMFMFDQQIKKRVGLVTGETIVDFGFQYQDNDPAKWVNFGWKKDAFGEWEDVTWE